MKSYKQRQASVKETQGMTSTPHSTHYFILDSGAVASEGMRSRSKRGFPLLSPMTSQTLPILLHYRENSTFHPQCRGRQQRNTELGHTVYFSLKQDISKGAKDLSI